MRRRGRRALVVLFAGGALAATAGATTACATTDGTGVAPAEAPAIAATAAPSAAAATAASAGAAAAPANPWLDPTRDVLVQHCGRCHRGDLPTAVPDALAIFDLTRPVWNERLVRPQYDGILTRVRESGGIEPDELRAVEAFVRCARDGECGAS